MSHQPDAVHHGSDETQSTARTNPVLAAWRLLRFMLWTAYCYAGVQWARFRASSDAERARVAAYWTHRWCRRGARIFGVAVTVRGTPPDPPVLLTPNHLGYLDVMAIAAAIPTLFVSKADVLDWPIIGFIFATTNHIAIHRADRRALQIVNESVAHRLAQGVSVCVFLEGTSTGGDKVLPFHASLAQPAVAMESRVAPMALHWRATHPGTTVIDDVAYWKDDHVFVPHGWRVLGLRGIEVTVEFSDPFSTATRDRKTVANDARARVVDMLEQSRDP